MGNDYYLAAIQLSYSIIVKYVGLAWIFKNPRPVQIVFSVYRFREKYNRNPTVKEISSYDENIPKRKLNINSAFTKHGLYKVVGEEVHLTAKSEKIMYEIDKDVRKHFKKSRIKVCPAGRTPEWHDAKKISRAWGTRPPKKDKG